MSGASGLSHRISLGTRIRCAGMPGTPDPPRRSGRTRWRNRPSARTCRVARYPAGLVADLACGPSGSALLAAALGRQVTAVDVSAVALDLLGQEARRRGLAGRITLVHADLASWHPDPAGYSLVLCTGFWDPAVFAVAARATAPGGVLGWEAFTDAARQARPTLDPAWCLGPGEPATLLPGGFTVLTQHDVPSPGHGDRRRLLARRPH